MGDPGVKGVLLKLAHPRCDTRGMSRKRASFLRLRHPEVIKDHPDGGTQKIMLITLGLKNPSHFGELLTQAGRDALGLQPSGHHDSKIRLEGVDHLIHLIVLLDGPIVLLADHAML